MMIGEAMPYWINAEFVIVISQMIVYKTVMETGVELQFLIIVMNVF